MLYSMLYRVRFTCSSWQMNRYSAMSAGDVSSHPKTKVKCSSANVNVTPPTTRKTLTMTHLVLMGVADKFQDRYISAYSSKLFPSAEKLRWVKITSSDRTNFEANQGKFIRFIRFYKKTFLKTVFCFYWLKRKNILCVLFFILLQCWYYKYLYLVTAML